MSFPCGPVLHDRRNVCVVHLDVDVQQSILNAKTPARKALKGRTALQENSLHGAKTGAKTVLSKKNILHTPFRPDSARTHTVTLPSHHSSPLNIVPARTEMAGSHSSPFPSPARSWTRPCSPSRVAAAGFDGATPGGMKPSKLVSLYRSYRHQSPCPCPFRRTSQREKEPDAPPQRLQFQDPAHKGKLLGR